MRNPFFLSILLVLNISCCNLNDRACVDWNDLHDVRLFHGNDTLAYRDPAVLFHKGTFHLFFSLVRIENDSIFSYVAYSKSKNLKEWTDVRILTPRDQQLNYSSPGNVVKYGDEWLLCMQTYPRPDYVKSQIPRYGDSTARIYIMRSHNLVDWSEPELLHVKGPDIPVHEMGRMIDPYLIEDKDEAGKWWCLYKQNGVSMSYTYDFKNWTYAGSTESGENVCVWVEDDTYKLMHSPANGLGVKISQDLLHWTDLPGLITLGQGEPGWDWARGRLTAGAIIDGREIPGIERYLLFFHGSGPQGEQVDFDSNASIGIAWSTDFQEWSWPEN